MLGFFINTQPFHQLLAPMTRGASRFRLLLGVLVSCFTLWGCETQSQQTRLEQKPTFKTANTEKAKTPSVVEKKNTTLTNSNEADVEINKNTKTSSLPPEPYDLWDRVRQGFAFSEEWLHQANAQQRLNYQRQRLKRSPSSIKNITKNAEPYLHFIVSELEKHQIPLELALLPIVESHYDPFAYSPGQASGLWQFIPGTGKRFGLEQNWWHDERRDVVLSTGAAIQYLLYLNKRYDGDWLLALAAYNAGQGNVSKAIRANKKQGKATDFWSLNLPKETRHYVPKLLVWREAILQPERFQGSVTAIANKPYFELVNIDSQIDLAEIAKLAKVDIDTVYQLNPAFNRWASDPAPPHDIAIPVEYSNNLKQGLTTLPKGQRITWRRYIIQKNDSLGKIAQDFNTSIQLIAKINGLRGHRIQAGKALLIPSSAKPSEFYSKSAEQRAQQPQTHYKNRQKYYHTVKSGESLWSIAKQYNVSTKNLARWNQLSPKDVLSVNKKLIVWQKASKPSTTFVAANNERRKMFYKVKQGDSLSRIANRFNVKISDIKHWNSLQQKYLQPGQLLTLYIALTDRQILAN